MDFATLKSALSIPSSGTLSLAKGALGPAFDALLDAGFGGGPLVISQAKLVAAQPQTLAIDGTLSVIGIDNVPVAAVFSIEGTEAKVQLDCTLPKGWRFAQSFPDMPKMVDWGSTPSKDVNPLDALKLSAPRVIAATHKGKDVTTGATLAPGLTFTATYTPDLKAAVALTLFGNPAKSLISGPIQLTGTAPELAPGRYPWTVAALGVTLSARMTGTAAVGKVKLDGLTFRAYAPLSSDVVEENPGYGPRLALGSTVSLATSGLTAAVTMPIDLGANSIEVATDFTALDIDTVASLAGFADIAGNGDLGGDLPQEAKKPSGEPGKLGIKGFAFGIGRNAAGTRTLSWASLAIGMDDAQWDVLPGHFTVTGLQAGFFVSDPFDKSARHVEARLRGDMNLEGFPVTIRANNLDGWAVYAELAEGKTIPLKSLMANWAKGIEPPGDLTIDRLAVEVHPSQGVGFALALAGQPRPWEIPLGPRTLTVSDVTCALNWDKTAGTSGFFAGTAALGDGSLHLGYAIPDDVEISARLPEIQLTKLFDAVGGVVSPPLPSGFPDLVLTGNAVGMTRHKDGQGAAIYDFKLRTTVEVNGTPGLNLAAHLLRANSTTGFAAAVWTPKWPDGGGWSPGSLWKPLSALEFSSAGLVISSIAANEGQKTDLVPAADVPAAAQNKFAVVHGVSLFASLTLHGDELALFRGILGNVTFDLYASYETTTRNTALIAHLDLDQKAGAFEFKSFELAWASTGTSRAAIAAAATGYFHFDGQGMGFTVSGGVATDGTARIALAIHDWNHPFGYQRLVVRDFGVAMAYDSGVVVSGQGTFGFKTHNGKAFDFAAAVAFIDFEAPSAIACALKTEAGELITVGEVLEGITTIDVYNLPPGAEVIPWVAQIKLLDLFLKFRDLQFWAVAADEVTIDKVNYRKGFGFRGDLTIFDKSVVAYLDVREAEKQFAGGAELPEEVVIGDVVKLQRPKMPEMTPNLQLASVSGVEKGKGPIMAVASEITTEHPHYIFVAAHVEFFDIIKVDLYGEATDDGIKYVYELSGGTAGSAAWISQTVTIMVSRAQLYASAGLAYKVGMKDVTLGGFNLFGILPVPEVHVPDFEIGVAASVGTGLNPPQFHLGGSLTFHALGHDLNPSFNLDLKLDDAPQKLAKTGELAYAWIKQELEGLIEAAFDHVDDFVKWVKHNWEWFKQEAAAVAKVLREIFNAFTNAMVRALLQTIGYAEEAIEAAIELLEEACSMTRAALSL